MDPNGNENWLNQCKALLRKYPRLYNIVVWLIAPCYLPVGIARRIRQKASTENVVINLGAGTLEYGDHVINVDIQALPTIDCVADAHTLPIADNSVDRVICLNTLEHVANPEKVIKEIYRVLKPGGATSIVVPFLFGFHAAPYDFHRWTAPGLAGDFGQFEQIEVTVASGPTSSMLAIMHEWLAILLSFNNEMLYRGLSLFFMVSLSPLKFIDLLLSRYQMADVIGCTFQLEAVKPKQ